MLCEAVYGERVAGQQQGAEVGGGLGPAARHAAQVVTGQVQVLQLRQPGRSHQVTLGHTWSH